MREDEEKGGCLWPSVIGVAVLGLLLRLLAVAGRA